MAELGKMTLKVSVDEVNLLRKLCSEGVSSRKEQMVAFKKSSKQWRVIAQEIMALEHLVRSLV